jgi:peroxin-14
LETDKALVTAKFDEAQEILEALKAETADLKESQEKQAQKVDEALESVEKAVNELRESGNRRESDIRGFKADIDAIRELIPKVSQPAYCVDIRHWSGIKKLKLLNYKTFRMNLNR